jgi:O-glycosyl hydrolase
LVVLPVLALLACGGDGPSTTVEPNPTPVQPGPTEPGPTQPSPTGPAERVVINSATRFQTIDGWATHLRMWEEDKGANRFDPTVNAQAALVHKYLGDEVGINSVRLEIPSAIENPTNRWKEFSEGRMSYTTWQSTRFEKINDNADPNVANMAGFTFENLDWRIDRMLLPLKAAVEARGEKLHINVNYTDFKWSGSSVQGSLSHANNPNEFAEFVTVCFLHLRNKYGIVPDAFEVILEPDNTDGWRGANIGRGLVAAVDRLRANGFTPEIIAPSGSTLGWSISYFDEMMAVPGVPSLVKTYAYHRYGTPTSAELTAIRSRAQSRGMKTAMLEKVDAGIDVLLEDLTAGQVSAWQQWASSQITTNSDNGGYYARFDPGTGKVGMARLTDQLSQVFQYVRRGAVRIDARSTSDNRTAVAFQNPDGARVVVIRTKGSVGEFAVEGLPAGRYAQRFVSDARRREDRAPVTVAAGGLLVTDIKEAGVLTVFPAR